MAIYEGNNPIIPFKGDYLAVSIYEGENLIFKPPEQTLQGKSIAVDNTYNDKLDMSIYGKSVQASRRIGVKQDTLVQLEDGAFGNDEYAVVEINGDYSAEDTFIVTRCDSQDNPTVSNTYTIAPNAPTQIPLLQGVNTFFASDDVELTVKYPKSDTADHEDDDIFTPTPNFPEDINSSFDDEGSLEITGSELYPKPVQTLSPPTLRAIKVNSSYTGDVTYTDDNGDMWVADEMNADGSWVQRIATKTLTYAAYSYAYNGTQGANFVGALKQTENRPRGYSNFSDKVGSILTPNSIWCGTNNKNVYWIGILDILKMSLQELNVWLNNNPLTVTYIMQVPILHPAPSSPLSPRTNPYFTQINTDTAIKPTIKAKNIKVWRE